MKEKIISSTSLRDALAYALREGKHADREGKKGEGKDGKDKDERGHKKSGGGVTERKRSGKTPFVREKIEEAEGE